MPPVATEPVSAGRFQPEVVDKVADLKAHAQKLDSGSLNASASGEEYEHAQFLPSYPKVDWEPWTPFEHTDPGLRADPEKKALFSAASNVDHLSPTIGTRLDGIDLRKLTDGQKDELALLVAERTVVVFEDQDISAEEQLELARHFGPLHTHPTAGVPARGDLDEIHVVYADGKKAPDLTSYTSVQLYHSDVAYEEQPPGVTSLKLITNPSTGGNTVWSSGYALYSSLSPSFQKYLENVSALHSGVNQAAGSRANGTHIRRDPVANIHPVVRVHPVTGWKSVFVNPGFTRKIVGVPKAESDAVLSFLYAQLSNTPDFQVRIRWKKNQVVFWDNRVATHSAMFDFFPERRHALRATPRAEKPLSVAEYERKTGKVAKDRQKEVWKAQGYDPDAPATNVRRVAGYND